MWLSYIVLDVDPAVTSRTTHGCSRKLMVGSADEFGGAMLVMARSISAIFGEPHAVLLTRLVWGLLLFYDAPLAIVKFWCLLLS